MFQSSVICLSPSEGVQSSCSCRMRYSSVEIVSVYWKAGGIFWSHMVWYWTLGCCLLTCWEGLKGVETFSNQTQGFQCVPTQQLPASGAWPLRGRYCYICTTTWLQNTSPAFQYALAIPTLPEHIPWLAGWLEDIGISQCFRTCFCHGWLLIIHTSVRSSNFLNHKKPDHN